MDRCNFLHRLVLDNDGILNEHIRSVTHVDSLTVIHYWLHTFRLNMQATLAQLVGQTMLIGRFWQPRA